jgi:predicted DNA-binding antitoxin AbrB/MazE fold protein
MAEDEKKCEFWVIRYVPDAVKEEFANIGIVLLEAEPGKAQVRFTRDWGRVRCLDPEADVEMLEATERELQERLQERESSRARILNLLNDSFSNAVQLSSPKGLLTENPEMELDRLAGMYLETPHRPPRRRSAGRPAIVSKVRHAFTDAGIWRAMAKNIPVAKYSHPGERLKIDCGYRPNGVFKLFQAVPLLKGAESAKVLAFTYPQIREGIARLENAETQLTAIVEPRRPAADDEIAFAWETLERSSIRVVSTEELPQLAEAAKRDLAARH